MLNLVLFGPPGAGKGTQSERIRDHYGLIHLSTGDIFRANIKGETELGKEAKSYIDKGELVPDSLTIKLLESEVDKHQDANGYIFDGFPRTVNQAEALDKFLARKQTEVTKMVALEVEEEELIKRLLERGKESGRADDQNEGIIRNRIEEYQKKTAPLKDYYRNQDKFESIDGVGEIDEITNRLYHAIEKK